MGKLLGNRPARTRAAVAAGLLAAGMMLAPSLAAAALALQYDPALRAEEKQAIELDIAQLQAAGLRGGEIRYFDKIFGGTSGADVERYLGERIHVIVAGSTAVDSRLEPLAATASPAPGETPGAPDGPRTIATNIGSAIFYGLVENGLSGAILRLGAAPGAASGNGGNATDSSVEIRSTRAGVIQLGEGYVDGLPGSLRINALVHEARHSDCTGGLSAAEKETIRGMARNPGGALPLCAHPHVLCPEGHPYAGRYACDDHPWGAYSVDAVFAAAMALACDQCTSEAKATGEAVFVDSAIRYPDFQAMVRGERGDPDMSHTEVRLP